MIGMSVMDKILSGDNLILPIEYLKTNVEGQYFDRKSARIDTRAVAKTIIAFANASGGVLAIGVEDNGDITGFNEVGFERIDRFRRACFEYCKNSPNTKEQIIKVTNDKGQEDKILLLNVLPSNNRVIRSTSDDVFLRVR